MEPLLSFEGLSFKVGNRMLLQDINWQVMPGENWIVFGLNGSGKTTLLSIASGLYPAAPEELRLFGLPVTRENRQDLTRRIGFVSDSFYGRYYKEELVEDIILSGYFGGLGRNGVITDAMRTRAAKLTKQMGLKNIARKPIGLLSKGERQKAFLVRALLQKPDLLLLDEPCSGLDVLMRVQVMEIFRELAQQEQIATVCVTHHFDEIAPWYTHAMLLKKGMIHSQGLLHEVLSSENVNDFFSTDRHPAKVEILTENDGTMAFRMLDNPDKICIRF